MNFILRAFVFAGLNIAILLPVLGVASSRIPTQKRHFVFLFCILFVVDYIFLFAPRISFFSHLQWNWQGKALEFLWPFLASIFIRGLSRGDLRIRFPRDWPSWLSALLVAVLISLFHFYSIYLHQFPPKEMLTKETIFFQLTMPGLAEEMIYRGLFLSILNKAFQPKWKVFGVPIGLSVPLTAILFTTIHLLSVSADLTVSWNWDTYGAVTILTAGLLLGWLSEKTKSIWPCVLVHNLTNSLIYLGSFLNP